VACAATLRSGKSCPRQPQPDSELCRFHAGVERRRAARTFYTTRLSPDDQRALAVAAELNGVDAEIAILRILICRVLSAGDLEAARRGIDTLCRTLRARHELDEHSSGKLAASMERVLETLGRDTEVTL
jgi:hypothetical protein